MEDLVFDRVSEAEILPQAAMLRNAQRVRGRAMRNTSAAGIGLPGVLARSVKSLTCSVKPPTVRSGILAVVQTNEERTVWKSIDENGHTAQASIRASGLHGGEMRKEDRPGTPEHQGRSIRLRSLMDKRFTNAFPRVFLCIVGTLLLAIGGSLLFQPESFAAANGIALGSDPSLLSEYRAPGGMLFSSALFMMFGAYRQRFLKAALGLAALIFSSYGVARLIAVAADGLPSAALTQAMAVELALGAICLVSLIHLGRKTGDK